MATIQVVLTNGTTADANDVMANEYEIYSNITNVNVSASAGIVFSKLDSATVAGVSASQTLTNKTLTSPTITSPTITSPYVSSGKLGIGIASASADSLIHTWAATAGTVTAPTNTLLTLESNLDAYQTFLTPNNKAVGFYFGDADDNDVARFYYDHTSNSMAFAVNALAPSVGIDSSGYLIAGTGIAAADSRVHIWNETAGAVSATSGTLLTLENGSSNAFITFLATATGAGGVIWGDVDNNVQAAITYNHNTNVMQLENNTTGILGANSSFNVGLRATSKLFFDGVTGAGDTYTYESSANVLDTYVGGNIAIKATTSTISLNSGASSSFIAGSGASGIVATNKFYWDGVGLSGDTYTYESSANVLDAVVGGTLHLRINSGGINTTSVFPKTDNVYFSGVPSLAWAGGYTWVAFTVLSDERKKENIEGCLGLDFINLLSPVSFELKEGDGKKHFGLLAQEVMKILPNSYALIDHVEKEDYYGLKYEQLISPLIKSVQELSAKISALEGVSK